jgi:hypothetical protein
MAAVHQASSSNGSANLGPLTQRPEQKLRTMLVAHAFHYSNKTLMRGQRNRDRFSKFDFNCCRRTLGLDALDNCHYSLAHVVQREGADILFKCASG